MSWFSELTSKAEAMLVKLDQDAAQALQNPDNIRAGPKLVRQTIVEPNLKRHDSNQETNSLGQDQVYLSNSNYVCEENNPATEDRSVNLDQLSEFRYDESLHGTLKVEDDSVIHQSSSPNLRIKDASHHAECSKDKPTEKHADNSALMSAGLNLTSKVEEQVNTTPDTNNPRKFKFQTSNLKQHPIAKQSALRGSRTETMANGHERSAKHKSSIQSGPGADDIRASINRSLQEYSMSAVHTRPGSDANESTAYLSHFDNQPNLVQSVDTNSVDNRLNDRLQSSPSFSISFPENGNPSTDIASQILSNSALKKKSAFNIHKVINRLAGSKGQTPAIIGYRTKIRLRRVRMRAASYLRRLNYYFRTYPAMKYWMTGYLIVLQLLVVYVLFFYQPSNSSNYMAAQVK